MRLVAEAAEGTEIFVIDSNFRRVHSALNDLDIQLPPGLYTVKFKRGVSVAEVDADLLPGSPPVNVQSPIAGLSFASAAPMEYTFTSHEHHQISAETISRRAPESVGQGTGSRLFVFVRDIGESRSGNPCEGLTLHNRMGRKIIEFSKIGETDRNPDRSSAAWCGCNVELAPGFYRLRAPRHRMPDIEQSLILVKGWQLQVFLLRNGWMPAAAFEDPVRPRRKEGVIDLGDAAIFMARNGQGYEAGSPALRLTELARQGLGSGRVPVTADDLRQITMGKFENPMLGLYGAHLLLPLLTGEQSGRRRYSPHVDIRKDTSVVQRVLGVLPDGIAGPLTRAKLRELIERVVGDLDGLLGLHPDVNALHHELEHISGSGKTTALPMIRRSWDTLVRLDPQYSNARAGTIIARMADRIWGKSPWLVWQVPPAASRTIALRPERCDHILSNLADAILDTQQLEKSIRRSDLSSMEESILRYTLLNTEASTSGDRIEYDARRLQVGGSMEAAVLDTAQLLGLPVETLERNLKSALTKLDTAIQHRRKR